MKKKILTILIAVCMMFVLVACDNAKDTGNENNVETNYDIEDDYDSDNDYDAEDDYDSDDTDTDADVTSNDDEETEKLGTTDKSLLKPFLGRWAYENKDVHICTEADFTWRMYNFLPEDGSLEKIMSGTFTVDEENIYLYDKNDAFVMSIAYISMNNLKDDQGEELLRYISSN